jgi:hypothetical protein
MNRTMNPINWSDQCRSIMYRAIKKSEARGHKFAESCDLIEAAMEAKAEMEKRSKNQKKIRPDWRNDA